MRTALLAAALALLPACQKPAPAAPPPEPRTRPLQDDGTTARRITATPDRVRVQADLASVRAQIRVMQGEGEALPATLAELNVAGLIYPDDLDYDASKGTVTSRTYPSY